MTLPLSPYGAVCQFATGVAAVGIPSLNNFGESPKTFPVLRDHLALKISRDG
jgi:hypothetical protein